MSGSLLPTPGTHGYASSPTPPATAEKKTPQPQPRVRRRNRLITSCLECRRRKLKCDKSHPCSHCIKNARQCVFIAPGVDQETITKVKEQREDLERSLEKEVARITRAKHVIPGMSSMLPGQEGSYSDQEEDEDTKDLKPTHLVTEDAAYYENDGNDNNDDIDAMLDLGIRMGKVRLTERIGGVVRPRFSDELARSLSELPERESPAPGTSFESDAASWFAPSRDYVAPSSFLFAPGADTTSVEAHLLPRDQVDKLVANYWEAVHPIARTVHRPTFERQYQNFWINVNAGIPARASYRAVLFAALLSSSVAMSEEMVRAQFGLEKGSLVANFRAGTETALTKANFLRTTNLETLQAFVMYLIPLCRKEVSRVHSALTGSLIRLAECMGLHRDPTAYSTSPVEIQIRRLVWYQICFLDLRTSEATGPRPQIRLEDYDTQRPLNIDDIDLDRAQHGDTSVDVAHDRKHFTDMTITRMRLDCYQMHRFLANERPKLDQKRADGKSEVTITTLLRRLQDFTAAMEKIYLPMLNKSEPSHILATKIYGILSNKLYISLLQKYLTNSRKKMPERLRQVTLSTATLVLEHGMEIETEPALSRWAWYVGALHQHHCAVLLVSEMWVEKMEPAMEQRIWRCLDYSFDLSADMSNVEKSRSVLEDLVERTKLYTDMKRVRAPNNMPQALPRIHTQGRQNQGQGGEERAGSWQPGSAFNSINGTLVMQQTSPPQPTQNHQPGPSLTHGMNTFPGAMPTIDWGTFDMPAAGLQQPYSFGDPVTMNNNIGGIIPGAGQLTGSDASSSLPSMYAGTTASGSDVDALNDVDWNDIEKMFGGAEKGAGNMLIPPFTFPQFSATNLQWSAQSGMQ